MAVFDPRDWWHGPSRSRMQERRRPEEINREVVTRWLGSVALCLCFAALAPAGHMAVAFAGLLIIAAIASCCFAAMRQEPFHSPHLTPWDEAIWSCAAGLALLLWTGSPGTGAP